jgi:hypothetical protein
MSNGLNVDHPCKLSVDVCEVIFLLDLFANVHQNHMQKFLHILVAHRMSKA